MSCIPHRATIGGGTQLARLICVPVARLPLLHPKCRARMAGFYQVVVELDQSAEAHAAMQQLLNTSFVFGKVLCAN